MTKASASNHLKNHYNTLYLIDISAFIFRAFYAVRELNAPDGTPVNAVYGVASMLGKLLDEVDPKYIAVVYDSKEPSFRKDIYDDYKANRSEVPETLIPQFDLIEKLISLMGFPSFRQSRVEADDLIATLQKRWIEQDSHHRVVVVTGDKDLMALVNSKCQIWDTMKDVHYTEHEVIEKFGVHPTQIRDYLAMVGDSSDNIPGITGIGPKGAEILLKEFRTLEGVIKAAKAGKVKGKKAEMIIEGEKDALLSQELATLKDDIKLEVSVEKARFDFQVSQALLEFFKHYNFKHLYTRYAAKALPGVVGGASSEEVLAGEEVKSPSKYHPQFITINKIEDLKRLITEIKEKKLLSVDTETTSLDPKAAHLVGVALSIDTEKGYYIPVGHAITLENSAAATQLEEKEVLALLKPVLESTEIKKIGQNLKYDVRIFENAGVAVKGIYADTLLAAYLLDSSGQHNLAFLSQKYLNYTAKTYEEVVGKGAVQIIFDQVPIDLATRYSAEDAWGVFVLWQVLEPLLKKHSFQKLFFEVDVPLVQVIADMEEAGIKVDGPFLKKIEGQFDKEMHQIEEHVRKFSKNPTLNLNSPKQLGPFLFEELKLPPQGKTKTGYSTDASVLEKIAPLHEVPRLLLEYREISKLKGTYVIPLQAASAKQDSRIRTSFHLSGTATGRLSSSDPNLQNIPTRTKRGQLIRQAFIAEEGMILLSADYSQIELRILAHLSGDEHLIQSFQKNEDVHRRTASDIFSIPTAEVTDQQRSIAKAINFGLMYGKSAFALAEELDISRAEAKQFIDAYFKRYSKVKKFLDETILTAKEVGCVSTVFGRKRFLPEIKSANHLIRASAERMAMNAPIQGTASDLIKIAMIQLTRALQDQSLKSKMLLQVHDELVLECPEDEVQKVSSLVREKMEGAAELSVPLSVNISTGLNWAEL